MTTSLAIGLVALVSLGACTSDGSVPGGTDSESATGGSSDTGGGESTPPPESAPAPEPTDAPAPEPTDAPAPEPAPVPATPETQSEESGLTTEEWVLLIILGLAAFALIIGVTSMATNHSEQKKAQALADRRRVGEIVGLGRWLVDQGSVDVLRASDAHQLETSWMSVRQRAIDIETRSSSLAASVDDSSVGAALEQLALHTASFRTVLQSNVSMRLDPEADSDSNRTLIADTTNSVYQRRQDVDMDLSRLSSALQGM